MKIQNSVRIWLLGALALMALVSGCGGGGGGPVTRLSGRILLAGTGARPDPVATVRFGTLTAGTFSSQVQTTSNTTNGTFTLEGVPVTANAIQVTIITGGTETQKLTQSIPTLAANTPVDLGDIFLSSDGYQAKVTGRVVRGDTFEPVSGALIRFNGQFFTTGSAGTFSFQPVPVGLGPPSSAEVGVIKATGLQDKPIILDLPVGGPATTDPPGTIKENPLGDVIMSLPVGGVPGTPANIRGTVTVTGQTDLSGTTVKLSQGSTVVATVTTGTDGKYGFFVVAGNYTITASRTGSADKTATANLTSPAATITQNFTFP